MTAPPNCESISETIFEFDRSTIAPPSEILGRFADRTIANRATSYVGDERRCEPRHPVAIDVLALPLDKNFKKCGEPFFGITRDLSNSGIAIFHNANIRAKYMALEIILPEGERLRLIMNVVRSCAIGMFYEVGGRFVKKFGLTSPTDAEAPAAETTSA